MGKGAHIAVLTRRFPKVSETFVLFEMLALEAAELQLSIFHLAPPSDDQAHPDVALLNARVKLAVPAVAETILRQFLRAPLRTLKSIVNAFVDLGPNRLSGWRQAITLADEVRQCGATVLYAHFIDQPAGVARIAAGLAGVPYAISAHAKDIYLTPAANLRRRMRAAAFVTTCTAYNAAHLKSIAPSAHILRSYHGVDAARFSQCEREARTNTLPLLLSVGRLRPKKGFDTLIDACSQLVAEGLEFRCEIIGYGPEEGALRAQIQNLGLGSVVTLVGKRTHAEVLATMRKAAAFALPSRVESNGDRDGVPNVILEAMASGVPVVSTCISGIPEAVEHEHTGLLVAPDDAAALAQALRRVLTDLPLAATLAANGRSCALGRFSRARNILALASQLARVGNAVPREIAYVVKGFPRLSESFITNEVLELEAQGMLLRVYSLNPGEPAADSALEPLQGMVLRLPETSSISATPLWEWLLENLPSYAPALALLAGRHPVRLARTVLAAIGMVYRYRGAGASGKRKVKLRKSFLKELLQSCWIAASITRHPGVRHLHGHFCHGATTTTWFVSQLTGLPFSFTAHAKDIYQRDLNPGDLLTRKLRAARFAVTCTGANHQHLVESAGKGACCGLHTVYHGLDVRRFAPPAFRETADVPMVLAVGRHVAKKGFVTLIEACHRLAQRGFLFHCRIVGDEGDATPAIKELITRHGLGGVVQLLPPVPQAQLGRYYNTATMFVLPCIVLENGDRDGIPNVLAEAMATGLPVITTAISGIPEIVEDDRNGLFVPPDDPDALAGAMARLIEDAGLSRRLGMSARATILEKFDSSLTTRRLHALLVGDVATVAA